jgi:CO/xanthine dehydrogenase Mo-binding subunit
LRAGDIFATGETLHDVHFAGCLEAVANGLGWRAPEGPGENARAGPAQAGDRPGHTRRGLGLAVMIKSTVATSKSQCRITLADDGQATVFTSTVEMGQGTHTALAQIAAEALDLPFGRVAVIGPDTAVTPFDSTTSASRSVNMMGNAVRDAAQALRQRLLEAAVALLEAPVEALQTRAGTVFAGDDPQQGVAYEQVLRRHGLRQLEAQGEFSTRGVLDPETGQGIGSPHYHQGAGACEVEVDTQTGKVTVLRYHAASFAGRVVNPSLAKLQNDGNVIYGLGPSLMEEMVFSEGQLLNANLSDYQIPAFQDVPAELQSASLEAPGSDFHGIGEMTLPPVAPTIANAIFAATGARIRDLPITAEKVLRALQHGND